MGTPGTQARLFSCILATTRGTGGIAIGHGDGAATGTAMATAIGMAMAGAIAAAKE